MKRKIYISLLFLVFAVSMNAQSWPRFFWNQIIAADTVGAIAIATSGLDGAWSDSLRFWQGKLRIGVDTAATLADVRSIGFNETGTANTLPLWATTTTLGDSWLSQSGSVLSLATTRLQRYIGHTTGGRPAGLSGLFGFNTDNEKFEFYNGTTWANLGDNFANTNLTFSDDKTHTLASNNLTLSTTGNINTLKVDGVNGRVGVGAAPTSVFSTYSTVGGLQGGIRISNGNSSSVGYASLGLRALGTSVEDQIFLTGSNYGGLGVITPLSMGHYAGNAGGMALVVQNTSSSLRVGIGTTGSHEKLTVASAGVGLLQPTPLYDLDMGGVGALRISAGTSSQRPTEVAGLLRYNTTLTTFEGYDGVSWNPFATEDVNFANTNLLFTENRVHELGAQSLTMGSSTYPYHLHLTGSRVGVNRIAAAALDIASSESQIAGGIRVVNTNTGGSAYGSVYLESNNGTSLQLTANNNTYAGYGVSHPSAGNIYAASIDGLGILSETIGTEIRFGIAAAEIAVINSVGIGINTVPAYSLDIDSTDAIRLPVGTTAQRPLGALGVLRASSTNSNLEGYDGTEYKSLAWHNSSNFVIGNYDFNIDQTVGTAQDDYIKGYNDTSGEIELRPSGLSTRGQLIETVLTSLGTLSTSYAHVKNLTSQNLSNFTATDSTLTYTGSETILVEINYSGSVFFDISTSGTYNTSFLPYVNGTQKLEAISTAQMTADGAEDWIFPFSGTTWVELSTNDVISLRRKGSSALTASLSNLSLTVKAL